MIGALMSRDQVAVAASLITELARGGVAPDAVTRAVALLAERVPPAALGPGADRALLDAIDPLWDRGWTPHDVVEVVRRRLGSATVPLAEDLVAADAVRRPATWSTAGVEARVWWDDAAPMLSAWAVRGLTGAEASAAVVRLVGTLLVLPALPAVPAEEPDATGIDPRVLARVRGLLAKAESTTFAEEAEALSAKAQELMARHALAAAVVGADSPSVPTAGVRRLWLDAPYVSAKSSLVHQVAVANRCRAVGLTALDLVTVVGHPTDLDTVELLTTSLLVQAGRAMAGAGPGSRTRSFRHAFLLSYATRIGERLREAGAAAEAAARAESGDALLPVLAARGEVVERTVSELFPRLTTKRFSVGNAAGWRAGRDAADAASLRVGREALRE
ncbi:DUF2786 domain-containing protein [Actinomycetospora termitidis]|uniref:DUF2786 domain-containing protein n=1 Tax=Actinomycetospora termitidis TaxID=3053470 RepID=A0ABT7M5B4_9PSEU|nr:DUF2786 domain-containing protein [Actinomycetospora sp. Odt1-22]MDL5154967.1 DUF2786 domain-containing protein [Actinomycetospora sp. Odt1-22]